MDTGGIAGDQLRSLVERYERLQKEIEALNEDRSELMKQVKSATNDDKGFAVTKKDGRRTVRQFGEEETTV